MRPTHSVPGMALVPGIAFETPGQPDHAPALLEAIVQAAEKLGASDIHLHRRADVAEVAFRLDGVLAPVYELPGAVADRIFGRIKFLARLKTYVESLPQEGRIERQELHSLNDLRVATYPTVSGEKIVLRLFHSQETRPLKDLALPASAQAELQQFLGNPAGMLLLTGPAGSGKTTTIYACLRHLADGGGRHIITIEDPAEQIIPGIMQTEINEARGLTYAEAARHLLRQDPQVLVIGEIRDDETARIAVRAALTGHLVVSTLHAGSCRGVLERLVVLCPDASAVAASTDLILNQRLIRRMCRECAGRGCDHCLSTGFHGRVPLVETLRIDARLRRLIANGTVAEISAAPPLSESARLLVDQNVTTESEIRRVLG
jgi:general secretion pathway protein E